MRRFEPTLGKERRSTEVAAGDRGGAGLLELVSAEVEHLLARRDCVQGADRGRYTPSTIFSEESGE